MVFRTVFSTEDEERLQGDGTADVLARLDARHEDTFWRAACPYENYFRTELDYEDYAPAYCVGYTGRAQYGGTYEDAKKCLWANWLRIKGDSRLSPHDACMAMRAAWSRMESLLVSEPPGQPALVRTPARRSSVSLAYEAA